jgi:hypothetical protein
VAGDANPRSNLPGRPALDVFIAPWFYLGIVVALAWARRPSFALPLVWLAVMLLPTALSEYAPHFRRAIGAVPAVALLIGLGISSFLAWARERPWPSRVIPIAAPTLVAIGLLVSSGITARDYFLRWGPSPDLYYAYDVGLWDLGRYIAGFPEDGIVYLTPRSEEHTTLAFAWRESRPPITFDGRAIFPFRPDAPQDQHYLVIEHEDFRTPLLIRDLFPQAEMVRDFRDRTGRIYARHYLVPAGAQPYPVTEVPVEARWPGVTLRSYSLLPRDPRPGKVLYVRLLWAVEDPPPGEDWTFFAHVLDPKDPARIVASRDARPGDGSYPTVRWRPGQHIVDEYQVFLPEDLPPGAYPVEIGFYTPDGQRLPVRSRDDEMADHIILGPVEVSAP